MKNEEKNEKKKKTEKKREFSVTYCDKHNGAYVRNILDTVEQPSETDYKLSKRESNKNYN